MMIIPIYLTVSLVEMHPPKDSRLIFHYFRSLKFFPLKNFSLALQ